MKKRKRKNMKKIMIPKNVDIKGTSIKLVPYVSSIKKIAENNACLSDFFSKNSDFSFNTASKIKEARTKIAELANNNNLTPETLKEVDKKLFWCSENLEDQSDLFNYCVNDKKKGQDND